MNICDKLISNASTKQLCIDLNNQRLALRLAAIANIGVTEDGGSCRLGYSKEDRQAKELVKSWMKEAGLIVHEDAVGNVFGKLAGLDSCLKPVLCGSHVDTVPNGGHFDGVLGVISALEVIDRWRETGFQPNRSVEIVIFSDEEGTRFNASLTGSRLMMGELSRNELALYRDSNGLTFTEALSEDNLDASRFETARRDPRDFFAMIELHIEQGKVLEKRGLPVGIVSGIAGPAWVQFEWIGEAGHAGATPMRDRRDAMAGVAEWLQRLEQLPSKYSDTAVATVGNLEVFPGGTNVIPGEVRLIADIRDICLESRDKLKAAAIHEANAIASRRNLQLNVETKIQVAPTALDGSILQAIEQAIKSANLEPFYLPSGAGHDTQILGRYIPAGMIFVRCCGGISHSPKEWVKLEDISIGCSVLKKTLEQLVL